MLNDDPECEGEITWQRADKKSVIDFVLVSEYTYKYYSNMRIDEEKLAYDLADHSLIEVNLTMEAVVKSNKNKWEENIYYQRRVTKKIYRESREYGVLL